MDFSGKMWYSKANENLDPDGITPEDVTFPAKEKANNPKLLKREQKRKEREEKIALKEAKRREKLDKKKKVRDTETDSDGDIDIFPEDDE